MYFEAFPASSGTHPYFFLFSIIPTSCSSSFPPPSLFGQRTRKGRCPIEHRGEFPSVRPSERTSERPSVRGPEGPAPPSRPQPLGPVQVPAPRPLESLPRPQPSCSRPPATPPPPRAELPLESPCPPRTDGNSPLCSIGHHPLRFCYPA